MIVGCAVLISALAFAIALVVTSPEQTIERRIGLALAGIVTLGLILLCADLATYRLLLFGDRIERHGLLGERTVARAAIAGARIRPNGVLRLQMKPGEGRPFDLSHYLFADPALGEWVTGLENLDYVEQQAAQAALAADSRLGLTRLDREVALRRLGGLKWVAHLLGLGAGVWMLIAPSPYWLAIGVGVAVPPIVVAATMIWRGLITVCERDESPLIDLTASWLLPSVALSARMLIDLCIFDVEPGLFVGAALGLPIWAALVWANQAARKPWLAVFTGVISLGWGWAAGWAVNSGFDRIPPRPVAAQVIAHHEGRHPSLTLRTLEPASRTLDDISPSDGVSGYPVGATVQVEFRTGLLGWRYADGRRLIRLSAKPS